jgi:hypothetical protein
MDGWIVAGRRIREKNEKKPWIPIFPGVTGSGAGPMLNETWLWLGPRGGEIGKQAEATEWATEWG